MSGNPKLTMEQRELLMLCLAQQDELKAEMCRRNFYYFVQEFWHTVISEDPIWGFHIKYLCDELQKVAMRVIQRKAKLYDLVINIPPGTTKSTVVSQMFPSWCWIAKVPRKDVLKFKKKRNKKKKINGRRPKETGADLRFITGSHSESLVLELSDYSRDIVQSDKYKRYFPEIKLRDDKNTKTIFKNTLKGARTFTTVGKKIMGQHAHFLIIDDPVDPKSVLSDLQRYTANLWMDRELSTRKVSKEVTVTILIMQRLHEDDPSGNMLNKKNKRIKHICLPGDSSFPVKPAYLRAFYAENGGYLDPIRMDRNVLDELYMDLAEYGYAGQIGQQPAPLDGGIFRKDFFEHVVDFAPPNTLIKVRGWDLAATKEKMNKPKGQQPAYTACVKMEFYNGKIYITDVKRFRKPLHEVKQIIKETAEMDGPGCIQDLPIDPGAAGKGLGEDIASMLMGHRFTLSPESGDKLLRALPYSAQCQARNVILVKAPWNKDYIDELIIAPNGKFMDQVDASSRAASTMMRLIKHSQANKIAAPAGISNVKNIIPNDHHREAA